jgi:translocation and assembly module TamB
MSKPRIAVLSLFAFAALLVTALSAGGAWLLYTTAGLQWLATRAVGFAGKGLELDGVAGTLARGARIQALRYAGADIELQVHEAELSVSAPSLLRLAPHIEYLRAARVEVKSKPTEPRGRPPDTLELPVDFSVANGYIAELAVDLGKGPLDISNVRVEYSGGETKHRVSDLSFTAMGYAVSLRGAIDARAPFTLEAYVAAVGSAAPGATAFGTVTGNLSELTFDGGGRAYGARATATATVRPYDEPPLSAAQVKASGVDLHRILAKLPRTAITADLDLKRDGDLFRGPLRIANAMPGPYDKDLLPVASLSAQIATNLSTVGFTALHADLGKAGTIAGSGKVDAREAVLTLTTKRLDLQALQTKLRQTRLAGQAEITIREARQSVVADLSQDDIRLSLTAHRTGAQIEVPRFSANARGGTASGEGRVTLQGRQPFSVAANLSRFDPSAWGDFPAGSINATARAEGTIEGPTADVRFDIRDSRWLGAPLAGNGNARLTTERLARADINVTLGGNRVSAQGAFGASGDVLAVRFDAPRLDLIDRNLIGRVNGTAEVTGTFRAPRVRFDASGADVTYPPYGKVKALQARGVFGTDPKAPIELHATLTGLSTPQVQLRTANVDITGTRAAHEARLTAAGDRIDARVRARGGLRPAGGWSGTVLELVNRGEVPIELSGPVGITVAPALVHFDAFELNAVGGRLTVSGLDYAKGRLTSAGRLENLPVARIIALAAKRAPVEGTLRVSGQWNLASTPQLVGTVRLTRDSGDLVVGTDRKFALGLKALSAAVDLGESGLTFQARAESALASASGQGRIGANGRGDAIPYSAASALEFTAAADIARLAPFAAFIDTAVLIEGEAHAKLQGRGTVGDPQITGGVTAQKLGIALPAEGVSLTNGSLVAVLGQREILLESFSIRGGDGVLTAQGTLARTGFDRASVDWRAEKFTALARPDRKLVVSGNGNAALEGGKLSFTGNVRADEGEFQIGGPALPTLGDDVVIVGRERKPPPEQEARKLQRFALDVRVDLGNQVHVTGHGLTVRLSGDVRVFTGPQGDIRATGTVNARNGTFVAYGQRLEIDRGRLYFNGPITNPALDVVAMRKRQAVEAGVQVTGTLRNPVVRVVSDPPLPEGEALSWLLLGRAPNEAGAGELSALPLATSALLGKATDPVKKALKLDEFGLRSAGAGDQFLALGKRIGNRMYIVFEQSLGAAESLLRLEYTLTRRISLRLQAGEPTSVGVFYRRAWD